MAAVQQGALWDIYEKFCAHSQSICILVLESARINNFSPFILYEDIIVHAITPSINFMACLSFLVFVNDIINQKRGLRYFNINVIVEHVCMMCRTRDPLMHLC